MTESVAPFIVAICAAFSLVIFVAGGNSVLTHVPAQNGSD